jgi:apolipoprotein N-acyltransferase
VRALPLICYEAIFPDEVAGAAAGADFILNVTNDAWFGDTPGPYQHFRQAQLRAVEFGIPLARAANNGVSAVVGADGRIVDGFALDAVGNLDVAMDIRRSAPVLGTPNVNGIGIMSFFAIFACAMLLARRWRAN